MLTFYRAIQDRFFAVRADHLQDTPCRRYSQCGHLYSILHFKLNQKIKQGVFEEAMDTARIHQAFDGHPGP
jgi:hypothetical protein